MTTADGAPPEGFYDRDQPDGNFEDEPLTDEQIAAQKAAQDLADERMANRQGPSHPKHWGHAEWLAERGVGLEWDNR